MSAIPYPVEIVGGPRDGEIIVVPHVDVAIRFPVLRTVPSDPLPSFRLWVVPVTKETIGRKYRYRAYWSEGWPEDRDGW